MKLDEHSHQTLLFEWASMQKSIYPELEYFHAIPNGSKLPFSRDKNGKAFSNQGIRMKKEGLKKGVPDTCLPSPRSIYHGFYLELKSDDGRPTPDQKEYVMFLQSQGFFACLAYGFDDAKTILEWYLNLPPFNKGAETPEPPKEAILTFSPGRK